MKRNLSVLEPPQRGEDAENARQTNEVHKKLARRKQFLDEREERNVGSIQESLGDINFENSSPDATSTVPTSPTVIYDAPILRYYNTQHRLVRRAGSSGSGDAPVIIGAIVGGLAFIGIVVAAILLWRRGFFRTARATQLPEPPSPPPPPPPHPVTEELPVMPSPNIGHSYDDKPPFELPSVITPRGSIAQRSKTPTMGTVSPIDKSQIRHHSWVQREDIFGSPTPPPQLRLNTGIPPRASSTSPSPVSAASGRQSKRHSSILKRLGSRDLTSPVSVASLGSSRGPPPPRPPRPEDVTEEGAVIHEDIFELSASPSVKKKRGSKPLPALPTFLLREQEEEMKRRRIEEEKERQEELERMRRAREGENKVHRDSQSTRVPSGSDRDRDGDGDGDGHGHIDGRTGSLPIMFRKSPSMDSLSSSSSSSSSESGDEQPRRPSPEVNPLSPRSSQGQTSRSLLEQSRRPSYPTASLAGSDHRDSASRSQSQSNQSNQSTPYLVKEGSNVVEASAVTSGQFPSPTTTTTTTVVVPLRVVPPSDSRTPTPESSSNGFGPSPPPLSATVPTPPRSVIPSSRSDVDPLDSRNESAAGNTSLHRTESTSSGDVAASGEERVVSDSYNLAIEDHQSERAAEVIEDWRESIGESYAATRPTTAGATPSGGASTENIIPWSLHAVPAVIVQEGEAVPRPGMGPRKISIDTGVGGITVPKSISNSNLSALTPSTANTLGPAYPRYEAVPISAVAAPTGNGQGVLRPSTPERRREIEKAKQTEALQKDTIESGTGYDVMSWIDFDDDSDSDDAVPGPSFLKR